jgi:AmmeMemoRadiSam system protein B
MDTEHPKLRALEAIQAQDGLICLRDPLGISEKVVFLPLNLYYIVSLFDGERSILDIQAAYTRQFGDILFSDKVRQIVDQLDGCLFLESERFLEAKNRAVEEFRKSPVRIASHAGSAYEREPETLRKLIGDLFDGLSQSDEEARRVERTNVGPLVGLIAPHIDVKRGGACFAASYAELARSCRAKTFVVLGISHVPTSHRFIFTEKDFDTPLGTVPTDRDFIARFVGRLAGRRGAGFFEDEFAHRGEHSVEFQALFLRYLFPPESGIRIVPILCSSGDEVSKGRSIGEDPEFAAFLEAMREELAAMGDEACCIAGVDLSHLGRRFGQDMAMTPLFLEKAEREDRAMIEKILAGDAEGFHFHIREERDRRNVCGVPAIYTLLRLLDEGGQGAGGSVENAPSRSRLLRYEQAVDRETQSVVTFMSAAFYARSGNYPSGSGGGRLRP